MADEQQRPPGPWVDADGNLHVDDAADLAEWLARRTSGEDS